MPGYARLFHDSTGGTGALSRYSGFSPKGTDPHPGPLPGGWGEVLGPDDVAGGHDDQPLHHVAELAHIARPLVGEEVGEGLGGDRLRAPPVFGREERDEVINQRRDIFSSLADSRDLDRNDVEPVE